MEKSQFVTIAVTAVVSVIAKEVVTWLVSRAKISAVSKTTKETTRKIFNKNNRRIIRDSAWLIWCITSFAFIMREHSPLTRWTVIRIDIYFGAIAFWLSTLVWDVAEFKSQRQREMPPPEQPESITT
jgi:hypothetical protein